MHETPEHPTLLKAPTLLMILRRYPELQSSFASTCLVMNMLGKLPFVYPNPTNILIPVFRTFHESRAKP